MTRAALILLAAGAVVGALAAALAPAALVPSWLLLVTLLLELSLGALALLLVTTFAGKGWAVRLRPGLKGLLMLLPLGIVALLPLFLATSSLFPWVVDDPSVLPETVRAKLAWLNLPFLGLRYAICAAVWLALAAVAGWRGIGTGAAAFALSLLVLTVSVYDIDWLMGQEPRFVSSIHPLIFVSSMMLSAMAAAWFWYTRTRGRDEESVRRGEDIANVTYGFLLIWAYMHFMQWLVIWAADRPHEIAWYLVRTRHGWTWLLMASLLLNGLAGIGLALRRFKRDRRRATLLAAALLVGQALDTAWRVLPAAGQAAWPAAGALALAAGLLAVTLAAPPGKEAADA